MAASEVYYMNARSESPQTGLVAKMLTVFEAAGLDQLSSRVISWRSRSTAESGITRPTCDRSIHGLWLTESRSWVDGLLCVIPRR